MASSTPNYAQCDIWRPHTASMATPSPLSSAEDEVSSGWISDRNTKILSKICYSL